MNHLILPEGVKPWIEVPYDAKKDGYNEKFSGGFSKYPEHRGWSEDDVMDWAKSQNDSEESSIENSNGKSGRTPSFKRGFSLVSSLRLCVWAKLR